jgi:penicillin-binding protein-related factor A (putative recombinase)
MSFGPSQQWDQLYILDTHNMSNIKIYKVESLELLKSIKVNRIETFGDQCIAKRRPRISLKSLLQYNDVCKLVFEDNIIDILG